MRVLAGSVAGVLGLALGSFGNVVIHRVPLHESVVNPRSHCPACGLPIRGLDNLPVLSWLLLRGRCRNCATRIAARYPLVELGTGALWAVAAVRFREVEPAVFVAGGSTVLLVLAAIDLEHRRVPNVIVVPATGAALVWSAGVSIAAGGVDPFARAAGCGLAAFALFFVIATTSGGMGFGDVKLAAFIGVVCGRFGWEVALLAVFGGFVVGGVAALVLLAVGRAGRKTAVPFAPALATGAVVALFAGTGPVRAWLGL